MFLTEIDPRAQKTSHTHPQIVGFGTASPAFSATQPEILEFILTNFPLKDRTKNLYKKTFSHPSIKKRHFSVHELSDVLEKDHAVINKRFEKSSRQLSLEALHSALDNSGLDRSQIDFLVTTTCTGYLCPGMSSHLIEGGKLSPRISYSDLSGMGCGGAIPAIHQAYNYISLHPQKVAAVVATEISSCALFSNDDPDIVISNTLFADGSACVLLGSSNLNKSPVGAHVRWTPTLKDFSTQTLPQWREDLRFLNEGGYLKNRLGKNVPEQSAFATKSIVEQILKKNNLSQDQIDHWLIHPGGEKILTHIEQELHLPSHKLIHSRRVLEEFGNMSSASVLFVLQDVLQKGNINSGDRGLMISFGAGFSIFAALLEF